MKQAGLLVLLLGAALGCSDSPTEAPAVEYTINSGISSGIHADGATIDIYVTDAHNASIDGAYLTWGVDQGTIDSTHTRSVAGVSSMHWALTIPPAVDANMFVCASSKPNECTPELHYTIGTNTIINGPARTAE